MKNIYRFLIYGNFCANKRCISIFCDIFRIHSKIGQNMSEIVQFKEKRREEIRSDLLSIYFTYDFTSNLKETVYQIM